MHHSIVQSLVVALILFTTADAQTRPAAVANDPISVAQAFIDALFIGDVDALPPLTHGDAAGIEFVASYAKALFEREQLRRACTEKFGPRGDALLQDRFPVQLNVEPSTAKIVQLETSATLYDTDGRRPALHLVQSAGRWRVDISADRFPILPPTADRQAELASMKLFTVVSESRWREAARMIKEGEVADAAHLEKFLREVAQKISGDLKRYKQ